MSAMFKDLKEQLQSKLGGQKYSLLGESLADLLRRATAKVLDAPDELLNQQVVDAIHQEVSSGKDTKEIVGLIKKRLRTDNPHKQWLAVLLVGKIMQDCSNVIGLHQEELLQEVARVMHRPARPDSDAGKQAKNAARDLLRSYGRAAASAFRAVQMEGRPVRGQYGGGGGGGYPMDTTGLPPEYAAAYRAQMAGQLPPEFGGGGPGVGASEKESVVHEVTQLIEQAKANTELLSDMLVNTDGAALSNDFENLLVKDLLTEVRELRGLFTAYLEQMQSLSGSEIEVLMVQALEAADMLDGALALEKEVQANLKDAPPVASSNGAAAGGSAANQAGDLIALDDLADAMATSSVVGPPGTAPPAAHDPFAASTFFPQVGSPPSALSPIAAATSPTSFSPPSYSGGPPAAAAPYSYSQPSNPYGRMQPLPPYQPNQPQGYQQPFQQPQQYQQYQQPQQYQAQQQPYQQQVTGGQVSAHNPFATSGAGFSSPPGSSLQSPQLSNSNPFAAATPAGTAPGPARPSDDFSLNLPMPPTSVRSPTGTGAATAAGTAPGASTVDAEWDMFFAGRAQKAAT